MANSRPVTNDRLYDTINSMRLELKGDITRLEGKFDSLEAGRLTRAEGNIADLRIALIKQGEDDKGNQKLIGYKFLIAQTIAYILLFVFLQALFNRIFK